MENIVVFGHEESCPYTINQMVRRDGILAVRIYQLSLLNADKPISNELGRGYES